MVRVEGPDHLQRPDGVGDEEVLGVGEEEVEPLQPGEGQLPLRPHGVLLGVGGWPDPGQLVPDLGQLGAHDGVEVGLGDLLGVGDEPDLPGVPLSVQAVDPRRSVDTALNIATFH